MLLVFVQSRPSDRSPWAGLALVEPVNGDVVGRVLLSGVVADGPAVGMVVADANFNVRIMNVFGSGFECKYNRLWFSPLPKVRLGVPEV